MKQWLTVLTDALKSVSDGCKGCPVASRFFAGVLGRGRGGQAFTADGGFFGIWVEKKGENRGRGQAREGDVKPQR